MAPVNICMAPFFAVSTINSTKMLMVMFALLSFLLLEAPLSYVYTCACACFANENQAIQQPDNEIREGV